MFYVIEKGVELPPPRSRRQKKYPLDEMEIGDSIFVKFNDPNNVEEVARLYASVNSRCYAAKKNNGKKFTMRKFADGYRVWRVE